MTRSLFRYVLALSLAALLAGCSGGAGSGGSGGTGGATGAGGSGEAGSGGGTAPGGRGGAGGTALASGGTVGSGGSAGTGGSGGSVARGGATGTGGLPATGGATGSGGAAGRGQGGVSGTGGSTGTGGMGGSATGAGGVAGSAGGSAGSGGTGGGTTTRSPGCGKTIAVPSASVQQTMTVAGVTRYYLLYIPTGYSANTPMPVIFGFHGRGQNDIWAADDTGLGLKKESKNTAILVYPEGTGDVPKTLNWGDGSFTSSWSTSGNDMDFIDQLYSSIANNWCVDETKVLANGFSMGGMMANAMGCYRGDKFRGIAAIEGLNATSNCTSKGVAALIQHDMQDSVVAYSQGQAAADSFRIINGCSATTTSAGTGYSGCVLYQNCRAGFPTYFCSTMNVDHHIASVAYTNVWTFLSSLMK